MNERGSAWPGADLVAEGRRRYEAGDYADAAPLAQRALELRADGDPTMPPAARSEAIQLAGEIAFGMGRYAEARSHAEAALALRPDPGSADHAESENLLGTIALSLGDVPGGLEHLERALAIREAVLGRDHPDTIESLNNSAAALARAGRVDEAIARNEDALARCQRASDGPTRELAVTYNALAVKLASRPETRAQAGELYEQALATAEAVLGPEHPMVATLLANLATFHLNADEPERARPLVSRSIELHERRHGPDHPNTATALSNAVDLARRDGRFDDARAGLERMLAIRSTAFGIEDQRTRSTLIRLIRLLGDRLAADASLRGDGIMLLDIHRRVDASVTYPGLPPVAMDPPRAARDLATYLERRRALAATDDDSRRQLDRARAALVAADVAFAAGDLDAARIALDGSIERLESVRGTAALELVEPLHRRAAVDRARDREDLALRDDERALAILAAAYGDDHAFVLQARTRLAIAWEREFGTAAARPWFEAVRDRVARMGGDGGVAGLAALIDRHLARIPADAEPDTIGRSARRRAAIDAPSPLVAELLGDLDSGVSGAAPMHGAARDLRTELRLLLAEDRRVVEDAATRLAAAALHQGTLHPPAVELVVPMSRIAGDPRVPHRRPPIELVTSIVAHGAAHASHDASDPIARAVAAHVPALRLVLDRLAGDADPAIRDVAAEARRYLDAATAASGGRPARRPD